MKNSKRLFYILLGFNLLLVGGILVAFTVASGKVQQKSQKVAQAKADLETNGQAIDNYKVLQATFSNNKDLEAIVQKALPTDKDQSAALADLDRFSQTTGLPVQQINFNGGSNKGTGKTLTSPSSLKGVSVIAVTLHSSSTRYNNLLAYLQAIETTQRRMQVTSVAITPNSGDPNLLDRVDLSIDIYLKSGS